MAFLVDYVCKGGRKAFQYAYILDRSFGRLFATDLAEN